MRIRDRCQGITPLTARLEAWQASLCARPAELQRLLEDHGSPVNVIDPSPMARNAAALQHAAERAAVDLRIFFARKANKALALVDEARRLGLGVDVASERELQQVLARDVPARDIIVTAAVKPRAMLELCAAAGVTVAIDNADELQLLTAVASSLGREAPIALRLAPTLDRPPTRFGMPAAEALALAEGHRVVGVHFHLDGYGADDRSAALDQSLALVDALRERGHTPAFVDMGGGIPMSYLDDGAEWAAFWRAHQRDPATFEQHPLTKVYPFHQAPVRGEWLAAVLGRPGIADGLRRRKLQLRCEPGRSLLDGCGLTAARVEFRKQRADGVRLIGLAMNRTQCRSTSDDFLVDPLLLRPGGGTDDPIDGYLVGAYCIERELLTWRRLRFPDGVRVGDIVVFPNTAGYLMHILESASHQIPLARNVIRDDNGFRLDAIDAGP